MSYILNKIRETIQNQGLSEAKLAKMVGMSQKTVNNLLAGRTKRPDPEKVRKIQEVLGIGIDTKEVSVTPITGTSHEVLRLSEHSVGRVGNDPDPIRQAIERELDRMTRKQLAELLNQLVSENEEGSPNARG